MTNTNVMWESDEIQFARLLAEIRAVGLTPQQSRELSLSMDLDIDDICEILSRAEDRFEAIKQSRASQPAGTAPEEGTTTERPELKLSVVTYRSTMDGAAVVEIETGEETGRVRVLVNEGVIWDQDPEQHGPWSDHAKLADTNRRANQPAGTAPGKTMSAEQIVALIREHSQDALRTAETVTDADQRQGWLGRAAALLELLTEIPGTTESEAMTQAARAADIDF